MTLLISITLDADPEYRNGEAGDILYRLASRIFNDTTKNLTPSWRSTLRDSGKKKVGTVRVVK